jgi:hypothetical protein
MAMNIHLLENLTTVLQSSISPVALISGVGLLILSMSNRLGRVMDRLRDLLEKRRVANAPDARADAQITVLHRRADVLRGAITAAATCVLLASTLVLVLFTMAVFGGRLEMLVIGLFASSILSLIISLVLFIFDLNHSLRAIEEELRR